MCNVFYIKRVCLLSSNVQTELCEASNKRYSVTVITSQRRTEVAMSC